MTSSSDYTTEELVQLLEDELYYGRSSDVYRKCLRSGDFDALKTWRRSVFERYAKLITEAKDGV